MRENRLMEVRYQDSAQGIMLTGYADTAIADPQYRLVGIRFGGYPEMVQGMSAAICGGATVTVSAEEQTYVLSAERGRYRKTLTREGAYTVATILWDDKSRNTMENKNEEDADESEKRNEGSQTREAYLLCAAGDQDALFHEIDRVSTIPMISQFADYLIAELQARNILTGCLVRTACEPFEAWQLTCTPEDQNIADVVTSGLKSGAIHIPGTQDGQADAFREIGGVASYLNAFGSVIAARIRGQFDPLYGRNRKGRTDARYHSCKGCRRGACAALHQLGASGQPDTPKALSHGCRHPRRDHGGHRAAAGTRGMGGGKASPRDAGNDHKSRAC